MELQSIRIRSDISQELRSLIETLGEEYAVSISRTNFNAVVTFVKKDGIFFQIKREKKHLRIECNSVAAAARAIGNILSDLPFKTESSPFKQTGIMLDVSRGRVLKVDFIKSLLRRLALCGCNELMLYTEDVYELKDYPRFGFKRGAYTAEDIRAIDDYAARLGITVIGCIQTLGHLERILKWPEFASIKDTQSVMLVDEPETYRLIAAMLDFWKTNLRSRRIHIGMDETHDLGRGRFMDKHGYEPPFDIFMRHLNKVNDMCLERGLSPMIWSDMFFRLSNSVGQYYDYTSPIPPKVITAIPKNLELVYWDYYSEEEETYPRMIAKHETMGKTPVMASGIWIWDNLWYDHFQTLITVPACVRACGALKLPEIVFTLWGDNASCCNFDSAICGIFFAMDAVFGITKKNHTAQRIDTLCPGISYNAFLVISGLIWHLRDKANEKLEVSGQALFWDDPLYGTHYTTYIKRLPSLQTGMLPHFRRILSVINKEQKQNPTSDYAFAASATRAVIGKIQLYQALDAYRETGDPKPLKTLVEKIIPVLIDSYRTFDTVFREQWLAIASPFGLETIQQLNATQIRRLEETRLRINELLEEKITQLIEIN